MRWPIASQASSAVDDSIRGSYCVTGLRAQYACAFGAHAVLTATALTVPDRHAVLTATVLTVMHQLTFPGGPRPNTLGSDHSTDTEAKSIARLCALSACLFVACCASMTCARIQVSCSVVVLLSQLSDVSRLSCVRLYQYLDESCSFHARSRGLRQPQANRES